MVRRKERRKSRTVRGPITVNPRLSTLFVVALFTCLGISQQSIAGKAPDVSPAQATDETTTKKAEVKKPLELDDLLRTNFSYQRKNRPDPFVPFISEQTVADQLESEEEVLTGMRLFEPGQLSLVAITTGGPKPFALVQDSTGKGYILEEGIAIGRRGVIKAIMPNFVSIEEKFLSSSGQKRKRTIEMVLRKEGEK